MGPAGYRAPTPQPRSSAPPVRAIQDRMGSAADHVAALTRIAGLVDAPGVFPQLAPPAARGGARRCWPPMASGCASAAAATPTSCCAMPTAWSRGRRCPATCRSHPTR